MKDIYCNVCGKKLFVEKGILKEDAFEAKKQWGYFSKKKMVCSTRLSYVKNVMMI